MNNVSMLKTTLFGLPFKIVSKRWLYNTDKPTILNLEHHFICPYLVTDFHTREFVSQFPEIILLNDNNDCIIQ